MTPRTFLKLLREAMKNQKASYPKDDQWRMDVRNRALMEELEILLKKEKIKQKQKAK